MQSYTVIAVPLGISLDRWKRTDPFVEVIAGDSFEDVARQFFSQRHVQDYRISAIILTEDMPIVQKHI